MVGWSTFCFMCLGRWSRTGSLRAPLSAPPSPNKRQSSPRRWLPGGCSRYLFSLICGKGVLSALLCLSVAVCRISDRGHREISAHKRGQVQRWGLCPKGRAVQNDCDQQKRQNIEILFFKVLNALETVKHYSSLFWADFSDEKLKQSCKPSVAVDVFSF